MEFITSLFASFSFSVPYLLIGTVIVLAALYWIFTLRVVVPTNMVHIVQHGKKTIEFGKGKPGGNVYYHWPMHIPVLGVRVTEFPESIFQSNLIDYEAYDKDRLKFVVDIAAFFRVESAEKIAQRISSFAELQHQLNTILQGAIRSILAKHHLEDIMEQRTIFADQFTVEVKTQLAEWGVIPTKPIELMDLRDAKGEKIIENIMSKQKSRIEMESRVAIASNKQIAETKEIEVTRQIELQKQEATQQVDLRRVDREQLVGIASEKSKQEIATQSKVTTERDMEVKRVQNTKQAEIERDVAKVKAEQNKQVQTINAEADKQVLITQADAKKQSSITAAEGTKESAILEATGIKSIGEAKAASEQAMLMAPVEAQIRQAKEIGENEGYQQYLITIRQIEAQQAIGIEAAGALQNADLKIIANTGDVQKGVNGLMNMFTPEGGTNLAGMMSGLAQTDEGKMLLDKFTNLVK